MTRPMIRFYRESDPGKSPTPDMIVYLRRLMGMPQQDFAKICGVGMGAVRGWEHGRTPMPATTWKYWLMVTRPDKVFKDHREMVLRELYPVVQMIPESKYEFEKSTREGSGLPSLSRQRAPRCYGRLHDD